MLFSLSQIYSMFGLFPLKNDDILPQGSGDMGVKLLSEFRYIVPDNILYSITLTPIRN